MLADRLEFSSGWSKAMGIPFPHLISVRERLSHVVMLVKVLSDGAQVIPLGVPIGLIVVVQLHGPTYVSHLKLF